MKKFYTLIAAAAVAMSAAAVNAPMLSGAKVINVENAKEVSIASENVTLTPSAKFDKKVSAKATSNIDLTGNWMNIYMEDEEEGANGFQLFEDPTSPKPGMGYYVMNGFLKVLLDETLEVACEFDPEYVYQLFQGEPTYPTLFIEPGTEVAPGIKLYVGTYDAAANSVSYYSDLDIPLMYDEEQEAFFFAYTGYAMGGNPIVITYIITGGGAGLIDDLSLVRANGEIEYMEIDLQDGEAYDIASYVLGFQQDETLYIYGFIGPDLIWFDLDLENGVATAVDQVAAILNTRDFGVLTFKWQTVDLFSEDLNPDYVVSATIENNGDGTSTLTVTNDAIWAFAPIGKDDGRYLAHTCAQAVEIKFDFEIAGLGSVNSIIADQDNNAPVVYYNLQGVRVDNPANGLYIRTQGSKSEKVVLK